MKTLQDFVHLTPIQTKVLTILNEHPVFYEHFYFTGGTLLKALGIVPRESNDLDFFTFHTVPPQKFPMIRRSLEELLKKELGRESLGKATKGYVHESGMILEFIEDSLPPIGEFQTFGHIKTASLKDIAAGKTSALCTRDEVKDLIDIALLTKQEQWLLRDLADFAEEKFSIGTMQEEKLFEELLAKKKMFTVPPSIFLSDGEKNVELVNKQVDRLLNKNSL
jgi:predicted nucleotidyltransferase component of viral defense system